MWKQIILPTVFVAAVWLVASGFTTGYILWLDNSYQRVLKENVTSIHAAGVVREALWRAQAHLSETGRDRAALGGSFAETIAVVESELVRLEEAATVASERALVAKLRTQFTAYRRTLEAFVARIDKPSLTKDDEAAAVADLVQRAEQMEATSDELQTINQRMVDAADTRRQRWHAPVLLGRAALLIVGPAVGIVLGWRIARRLHQSVSRVNITLRDAAANLEHDLGSLVVPARGELGELQQRVNEVVQRLRKVSHELQTARWEVLRSERLAAVGELAAGVAHELRNPLTSVKLLLQHAAQQPADERLSERELQVVLDEISRMESTIQGLLDFSRPPRLRRTRHDLRDTFHRALNLLTGRARQQRIDMRIELDGQPLFVDADPEQLHQVFVNLLLNGIEAMEQGGPLTVRAETLSSPSRVRLTIHDRGQGISDDLLPRLFEPFLSAKERGTGLGLAICQRIVTEHGGTITARNDPSGGAAFVVELPASSSFNAQPQAPASCD